MVKKFNRFLAIFTNTKKSVRINLNSFDRIANDFHWKKPWDKVLWWDFERYQMV